MQCTVCVNLKYRILGYFKENHSVWSRLRALEFGVGCWKGSPWALNGDVRVYRYGGCRRASRNLICTFINNFWYANSETGRWQFCVTSPFRRKNKYGDYFRWMLAELEVWCTHDARLKTSDDLVSLDAITRLCSLLEALRFKPEGRGFDSRWCHWNFFRGQKSFLSHCAANRYDYRRYVRRSVCRDDNLTTIMCRLSKKFWFPQPPAGAPRNLPGSLMGWLYFFFGVNADGGEGDELSRYS